MPLKNMLSYTKKQHKNDKKMAHVAVKKGRDIQEDRALPHFLTMHQLERQGADILTKVNELEEVNQSLRERDKNKDDAITMLSDQLLTITERLKELERKQQWE
jgi:transcriptional/translational regulatory protein YebC/TACO1